MKHVNELYLVSLDDSMHHNVHIMHINTIVVCSCKIPLVQWSFFIYLFFFFRHYSLGLRLYNVQCTTSMDDGEHKRKREIEDKKYTIQNCQIL